MTEFDAILQRTLDATITQIFLFLGVVIILGIVFTIGLIFVVKKLRTESMSNQDYERLKKKRSTLIFSLVLVVFALVVIPLGSAQRITDLKHDIEHQQYVCAEVDYSYSRNGKGKDLVTIIRDGEIIYVDFPKGWSEEDFPRGEFHGTAWYSEESKILLSFTADNGAEQNMQESQVIPMLTVTDVDVDLSGIMVNHDPVMADTQKLSITELQDFFGESFSWTRENPHYLHEINERFPVSYLRSMSGTENEQSYYIAYPVAEGGMYLVFLSPAISEDRQTAQLAGTATVYLSNLPEASDLDRLQYGDSFDTVKQIAPATLVSFLKSSAITSVSFLRDGTVAEITYQKEAYVKDQVLRVEKLEFNKNLALILPEDWSYITADQQKPNQP